MREHRERWTPATTANGFVTDSGNDHYALARLTAEERARLPQALAEATPVQAQSTLGRIFSGSIIPFAEAPRLFAAVPFDDDNRGWLTDELRNIAFRARDFPADTARWSQEFPPGHLRDTATTEAAKIWNDYDPAAARAWAGSLTDLSARAAAMAAIESP
jgi:hypothetical protein